MSAATCTSTEPTSHGENADRLGIIASVLCAIHCAATPLLLIFAPAFGELWSHPASHWIVALLVVPLALAMVLRGFRVHRKRWIVVTGLLGMLLIVIGAIIPYLPDVDLSKAETSAAVTADVVGANEVEPEIAAEEDFVWVVGEEMSEGDSPVHAEGCLDSCCPSLVTDSEGNTTLHVPTASVVSTLGGIALICTHLGNLCACRKRQTAASCESPFC